MASQRPGHWVIPILSVGGGSASAAAGLGGQRQAAFVLAAVVVVMLAGWASAMRSEWSVGDGWIAQRGLFSSTTLDIAAMVTVLAPVDEVRQGDLLFLGSGLRAVAVPTELLRRDGRAAAAVSLLLASARSAGVNVTMEAREVINGALAAQIPTALGEHHGSLVNAA